MKVAISMCCLHDRFVLGELNNVSFLKYAASLAVDGVELCDRYLKDLGELERMLQVLEETGLEVACYALTQDLEEPEALKQGIETGLQLGASCIRVSEPFARLPEILPYLEEAELTLCLDQGSLPLSIDSPYVKSTFHMADFFLLGERPHPKVGHVRASDLRLAESHEKSRGLRGQDGEHYVGSVLGLGLVEVQAIIRALWEQNYTGWIAVDFSGLESPLFGLEASLKNLRQYLREL
ncbi:MAG: sugar phosphate isomerase/epimerase [Firmicutes bacterium]|nr:sugar phosphate isomerase/epimerase [Bacillota bacterium]